jgi:GNAT superfamily N-acetyltransferase
MRMAGRGLMMRAAVWTEVETSNRAVQSAQPGGVPQPLDNEAMGGEARPRSPRALIRDATPDDVGAIARIGRVAFAAAHRELIPQQLIEAIIDQTYSPEALADCIISCAAAPDGHFLVAESDGQIRGYLHFDCFGPRPELHRIYVARELTGHGLGTQLLHELERRLDTGTMYVLLVIAGNEGALRFYTRERFQEEQRVEAVGYYSRHMGVDLPRGIGPVPAVLMRKTV